MVHRLVRTVLALSFLSLPAIAQNVTVGQLPVANTGTANLPGATVETYIDLAHPATASGTLIKASVEWSRACAGNAFKILFIRPSTNFGSFTVVAQRGPFPAIAGRNDITLSPPVAVQQYDLIAIVQLQDSSACGTVTNVVVSGGVGTTVMTNGDISSGSAFGTPTLVNVGMTIAAMATSSDNTLARIVPAAGATAGAGGSFFRTAIQLVNASLTPISGSLVYHPQGASATPGDPSLPFTLAAGQTVSYPDVISAMGQSGLGSLDIVTTSGAPPIVTARVFNDAGSAGTSGFTEDALAPDDVLASHEIGVLLMPSDITNFRMNIGLRTLNAGATVDVAWFDTSGRLIAGRTQTFPPNYFIQQSVAAFTGASNLQADWLVLVQVNAGSAIVYGTITDNRTNDSSMRIARWR